MLEGVDLVQDGSVDIAIVGGAFNAEDYQTRFAFAGSGMLSRDRTDSDLSPPRPWMPDADGLVLGSGAGFLVIEAAEHAERRHAVPYAEIAYVGYQSEPRALRRAAEWLTLEYRRWIESGGEAALAVIGNGLGVRTLDAEEMAFMAAAARAGSGELALTTCSPCIGDIVHASMPVRLALAAIAIRREELFPAGPAAATYASPEGVRVVTRGESRRLPSVMALSLGYEDSESFAVLTRCTPERRGS